MIKVAVAGAKGRMGKLIIDAVWNCPETELVAAIEHQEMKECDEDAGASLGYNTGVKITHDINAIKTSGARVLIDFTRPEGTLNYLEVCTKYDCAMVIGTTGFNEEQTGKIQQASQSIPIVLAPNMSTGVNVTLKILELAAKLLKDYDCEIVEMHHNKKVDSPSGTAIQMGKVVATSRGQNFEEAAQWARHGHTGPREAGSIGFAALRGGDVVGDHKVIFAGPGERIEISHLSASRQGYAQGAVKAALFIADKKSGFFGMTDVLGLKA